MREKLTKSDIEKIDAEIENRKLVIRPQLIGEVKEARAQGDLSENFEYYAAKRAKNQNEGRIRYLENMLKTAIIVSDEMMEGAVSMNTLVTLLFLEDNLTETYKIVTSIRGNSLKGKISTESPLGSAIFSKKIGDICDVTVNPNYSYQVKILSIEPSSDKDDVMKSF